MSTAKTSISDTPKDITLPVAQGGLGLEVDTIYQIQVRGLDVYINVGADAPADKRSAASVVLGNRDYVRVRYDGEQKIFAWCDDNLESQLVVNEAIA